MLIGRPALALPVLCVSSGLGTSVPAMSGVRSSPMGVARGIEPANAHSGAAAAPLRFRDDGSFQVSVFADLHFGENAWDAWGPRQDVCSVRVVETVLDAERPDLVVLNGDLITGENAFRDNSTAYLDQIVAPMVRRNLSWASTYGNHDSDYNLSRAALLARERHRWPALSRTANMVAGGMAGGMEGGMDDDGTIDLGVTNYYLPVYGSNCPVPDTSDTSDSSRTAAFAIDGCVPRLLLWFFDSRGGFRYQQTDAATGARVAIENWVDARVVNWFEHTHAALQATYARRRQKQLQQPQQLLRSRSPVVPSLAFVHIPPRAALALQMGDGGIDPHRQPGIDDDKPLAPQTQGWCQDGADGDDATRAENVDGGGCQDEPFMRALARVGDGRGVVALLSGHDHGDTWCGTWTADRRLRGAGTDTSVGAGVGAGVHMCFGQHSGYGGYGSWTRGARQLRITEASLGAAEAAEAVETAETAKAGTPYVPHHPDVETWIRLETGVVVGRVVLNATYGRDVYPATPNTHTHLSSAMCDGEALRRNNDGAAGRDNRS